MNNLKRVGAIVSVLVIAILLMFVLRYTVSCATVTSVTTTTTTTTVSSSSTSSTTTTATTTTTTTTIPEASGELDTSFGTSGVVTDNNAGGGNGNDEGKDIIIDSSGKIVVVGYSQGPTDEVFMTLWRYDSSGSKDTNFNGSGIVITHNATLSSYDNRGKAVAQNSSGKLIVAGLANAPDGRKSIVVWKFNDDGSADTGFGDNGLVWQNAGDPGAMVTDLVLDASDSIYVSGYVDNTGSGDFDMTIFKLFSDGTVDTSFGSNGYVRYHRKGYDNLGLGITLDGSNNILVAGEYGTAAEDLLAVWRYDATGAIDASFGTSGVVTSDVDDGGAWTDIAVDGSGRILTTGRVLQGANYAMYVGRYTASGSLDTTFSSDGLASYSVQDINYGTGVVVDPSGNILVAGYAGTKSATNMYVWRFLSTGLFDTSFGTNGVFSDDQSAIDAGTSLVLDSSKKILVTGLVNDPRDMAIWRIR